MRTAQEIAAFVLEHEAGPLVSVLFRDREDSKRLQYLNDLFRPIEQLLGSDTSLAAEGDDNVLYALTSSHLDGDRELVRLLADPPNPPPMLTSGNYGYGNIAVAFMVNRCILAYTTKEGKEVVWTIPYEEIIGITPVERKEAGKGVGFGELILTTTTGKMHFVSWIGIVKKKYAQFIPAQAGEVVLTLVTKYKQAKYAAQQGTAAPQYSQQTPPPKAPQGEAPQERSQWSAAQLDTAQRTAARLTAALQAPQPPEAAAPAASPAGAGLSAETVEALKQLKGLLDAGILTQEEFDAKKKQLLGL